MYYADECIVLWLYDSIKRFVDRYARRKGSVKISDWLDKKEEEGFDVSHIVLSDDLAYDEALEETLF